MKNHITFAARAKRVVALIGFAAILTVMNGRNGWAIEIKPEDVEITPPPGMPGPDSYLVVEGLKSQYPTGTQIFVCVGIANKSDQPKRMLSPSELSFSWSYLDDDGGYAPYRLREIEYLPDIINPPQISMEEYQPNETKWRKVIISAPYKKGEMALAINVRGFHSWQYYALIPVVLLDRKEIKGMSRFGPPREISKPRPFLIIKGLKSQFATNSHMSFNVGVKNITTHPTELITSSELQFRWKYLNDKGYYTYVKSKELDKALSVEPNLIAMEEDQLNGTKWYEVTVLTPDRAGIMAIEVSGRGKNNFYRYYAIRPVELLDKKDFADSGQIAENTHPLASLSQKQPETNTPTKSYESPTSKTPKIAAKESISTPAIIKEDSSKQYRATALAISLPLVAILLFFISRRAKKNKGNKTPNTT